jgi:pilus assembly protein CpaE
MTTTMRSLRGLIISEDAELRARVQELLVESQEVQPALVLARYPERREAIRQINLCRPEVVLLAIDRLHVVLDFLKELEGAALGIPIIGISRLQDPRALAELMRLGISDCVAAPLNRAKFNEAVHRAATSYSAPATQFSPDPLACFLPARGGSGTSTLACNISFAMSKLQSEHVLLTDLDFSSGLSRFLFNLTPGCSLGELLEGGQMLDAYDWRSCTATVDNLDIIHGGRRNPLRAITVQEMRDLLRAVSGRYARICVDLTGSMEVYALELLRRSWRILLVTTAEPASLSIARERLELLASMELASRTGVLLTLSPDAPPPNVAQVQALLGTRIEAVFDFGEKRVRRSLGEGSPVEPKTALGRQISQFAQSLAAQLTVRAAKAVN